MRLLLVTISAGALLAPASASACASAHYPDAVLFDRPPSYRPRGYTVLHVAVQAGSQNGRPIFDGGRLLVRLVDAAQIRRFGQTAWLQVENGTSCTGWGRVNGRAFVAVRAAGKHSTKPLLLAKVYQRSLRDDFWRLFGQDTYSAPSRLPPS